MVQDTVVRAIMNFLNHKITDQLPTHVETSDMVGILRTKLELPTYIGTSDALQPIKLKSFSALQNFG